MLHLRHMQSAPKQDVAFAAAEQKTRERELIAVVQDLVQELHPGRAKSMDVNALSRLERDLGIDSLARTELIIRIERAFGVRLSAAAAAAVETVGDLLRALDEALAFHQGSGTRNCPTPSCTSCSPSANAGRSSRMAFGHASRSSTPDCNR